jgi:flagellar capping protein FliD
VGAVADRLTSAISDIDSQISDIQRRADADIARLRSRKAVLDQSLRLLTPTLEAAVDALKKAGVEI